MFPGAASRYIESHFDDKTVALWSEGAAGDQNPVYFQQTYDLRAIRIKDYAQKGQDISNSMPPGGVGLDRNNPEVQHLMEEQKEMITSMGQMLGEEVLRVTRETKLFACGRPHFRQAADHHLSRDVSAPTKAAAGFQEHIRMGRMSTSCSAC